MGAGHRFRELRQILDSVLMYYRPGRSSGMAEFDAKAGSWWIPVGDASSPSIDIEQEGRFMNRPCGWVVTAAMVILRVLQSSGCPYLIRGKVRDSNRISVGSEKGLP